MFQETSRPAAYLLQRHLVRIPLRLVRHLVAVVHERPPTDGTGQLWVTSSQVRESQWYKFKQTDGLPLKVISAIEVHEAIKRARRQRVVAI